MSLDTLITLLGHQDPHGCAVSVDGGGWTPPERLSELGGSGEAPAEAEAELHRIVGVPSSDEIVFGGARELASSFNRVVTTTTLEEVPAAPPSAPTRGQLRQVPFAVLLHQLHLGCMTGRLDTRSPAHAKAIYVQQGAPCHITTDKPNELLGNFLVAQGVLTQAQLDEALSGLDAFGGRLGDLLVVRGLLPVHALFHYLSLQAREKLLDVFAWDEAAFTFHEGETLQGEALPLGIHPLEIIVEGVRTRMSAAAVRGQLQRFEARIVRVDRSRLLGLNGLKLTPTELSIAAELRSGVPLGALLQHAGQRARRLSAEHVQRILFLMIATDLLTFDPVKEGGGAGAG